MPKPEPNDPGQVVSERISVVKVSLASVVRPERRDFLNLVERVVRTVNQMAKRVSMLAKELLLSQTKLEADDPLPELNQSFFSALYTSLRSGKWTHGHDAILTRRRVQEHGRREERPTTSQQNDFPI